MAKSSPEIDLCVCAQGQNPELFAHVQHINNIVYCHGLKHASIAHEWICARVSSKGVHYALEQRLVITG
jgi:hypothetical protein